MAQEFLYGVRTRRVAAAGLDGLTPILLVAYLLTMIGGGIYGHAQLAELIEQKRVDPTFSPGVLWTMVIAAIVLQFALVGPMVLLGVFIASKIMKFPLGTAAYLKACGVATTPGLVLFAGKLLPSNFMLILIVMVAVVPVTYFVLKVVFELSFGEGAVSFLLACFTGIIGVVISVVIISALGVGGVVSNQAANQQGGQPQPLGGIAALPGVMPPAPAPPRGSRNVVPPANSAATKTPLDAFRETLSQRVAYPAETSRETQERDLTALRAQAGKIGATGSADVMNMLQTLETRAAAAPSEGPEPTLFQDLAAANAWRSGETAISLLAEDEVSFKAFNIRIPTGFRADLDSSEYGEKGLVFSNGRPHSSRLALRAVPVLNPKQRRPWVVRLPIQLTAAERDKLFTINGAGGVSDEGTINGIAFTRVVHVQGARRGVSGRSAQYVARAGNEWLIVDATASSTSGVSLEVLEAAARTIRPRPAADPKIDPLAPRTLVARLAEDPERVGLLLRERGTDAEAALLPLLTGTNALAARAAAAVLGDVGTAKSLPDLHTAARSRDAALAEAARTAIKKIQPDTMDAVAEALLDLESSDNHTKRAALERLARVKPDQARRENVAAIIEAQMVGKDAFFLREAAAPAMAVWAGKNTVPRLLPMLDEHASMFERQAAMQVFAKLKDERTVFPIVRWIIKDTDNVIKTLVEMGPVAEAEVIKLLKERDPNVRTAAARILQEIGTAKSLSGLRRASQDPRDVGAAVAAQVALDIVTDRWKSSKSASAPTTTTAP